MKPLAVLASVAALVVASPSKSWPPQNNTALVAEVAKIALNPPPPPPPPPPPQPTAFNASGDWPPQEQIDKYANTFSCYCDWDVTPLYGKKGKIKTVKYWTQFWVYGRNWGDVTEEQMKSIANHKTKTIDYDSWTFQRIDHLHVIQSKWRSVAKKDFQPPDETTVPNLEKDLTTLLASNGIDFKVHCLRKYPIIHKAGGGGVG